MSDVPDAAYRAHVEARLNTLETSLRAVIELVDRQRSDMWAWDDAKERMERELKELRDTVEGKS